ncbi:beta-alanine transporter-like [Ixodes scapularis]|uniref:beta-alanine transporter-like n=1 Tax=Ixodes scapularis TaxID=6945 RepID=UPI001AD627B7|nr:beta-alanine transporter-like [Ixodes scapularis]
MDLANNPIETTERHISEDTIEIGVGRFQGMVIFCAVLAAVSYFCHASSFALTARVMDHWCRPPDGITMSRSQWKNVAIPVTKDGRHSRCSMYSLPLKPENTAMRTLIPCIEWEFDLEEYGNTIISEWSLVCNRSWLIPLASLTFDLGGVLGGVISGIVADNIGRRPVVCLCVVVNLFAGFASGQTNLFAVFLTVRSIVAGSSEGLVKVLAVALYEVSPHQKWPLYCFTNLGVALLIVPPFFLVLSLLQLNWMEVHLAIMVPTAFLVCVFYMILESPRWLLVTGNIHEAWKVTLLAASTNRAPSEVAINSLRKAGNDLKFATSENGDSHRITIQRLLLEPKTRTRSAIVCFAWLAVDFAFSVHIFMYPFAIHESFAIASVVLVPICFPIVLFSFNQFDKESVLVIILSVLSVGTALLMVVYDEPPTVIASALLVFVQLLSSVAFFVLFTLTVELFPTALRCTGFSLSAAFGSVSTMFATLVTQFETKLRKDLLLALIATLAVCGALALCSLTGTASPTAFFGRLQPEMEENTQRQLQWSPRPFPPERPTMKVMDTAEMPVSQAPPLELSVLHVLPGQPIQRFQSSQHSGPGTGGPFKAQTAKNKGPAPHHSAKPHDKGCATQSCKY